MYFCECSPSSIWVQQEEFLPSLSDVLCCSHILLNLHSDIVIWFELINFHSNVSDENMNFHYYNVLVCNEARTRRENGRNYSPSLKVRVSHVLTHFESVLFKHFNTSCRFSLKKKLPFGLILGFDLKTGTDLISLFRSVDIFFLT